MKAVMEKRKIQKILESYKNEEMCLDHALHKIYCIIGQSSRFNGINFVMGLAVGCALFFIVALLVG